MSTTALFGVSLIFVCSLVSLCAGISLLVQGRTRYRRTCPVHGPSCRVWHDIQGIKR